MSRTFIRSPKRFFLIFLFCMLASCTIAEQSTKEDNFTKLIAAKDFNNKIRLSLPKDMPKPKIGDSITLIVTNKSMNNIIFPNDLGIRIFIYNDQSREWASVENTDEYLSKRSIMLQPKGTDALYYYPVGFTPVLEDESKPITIRVCVTGNVNNDQVEKQEVTAAYLDLVLEP